MQSLKKIHAWAQMKVPLLVETISLEIDECKSKNVVSVSEVLALLSWSSEGYI